MEFTLHSQENIIIYDYLGKVDKITSEKPRDTHQASLNEIKLEGNEEVNEVDHNMAYRQFPAVYTGPRPHLTKRIPAGTVCPHHTCGRPRKHRKTGKTWEA